MEPDDLARRMIAARLQMGAPQGLGPDVCWPWIGRTTPRGYGLIQYTAPNGKRVSITASRAIAALRGDMPFTGNRHTAMHSCDNGPCCNPAHILPGTPKLNAEDMVAKGRHKTSGERRWAPRHRKLTDNDVRAIRAHTGLLITIAKDLGVSVGTVARIRMGIRKAHVPDR